MYPICCPVLAVPSLSRLFLYIVKIYRSSVVAAAEYRICLSKETIEPIFIGYIQCYTHFRIFVYLYSNLLTSFNVNSLIKLQIGKFYNICACRYTIHFYIFLIPMYEYIVATVFYSRFTLLHKYSTVRIIQCVYNLYRLYILSM